MPNRTTPYGLRYSGIFRDMVNGTTEIWDDGVLCTTIQGNDATIADILTAATLAGSASTIASAFTLGGIAYTAPPDDGDAGEQLQTNGTGTLTWEAAASLREFKDLLGRLDPGEALDLLLGATVHRFKYREDARVSTGDHDTEYLGVMADELPQAMHHKGRIFNPVSAFGLCVAAIQALHRENQELRERLA